MTNDPHFDRDAFVAMTEGDAEFQRLLAHVFNTDTRKRIDSLRALVAAGDTKTANRQAHTVKGSAGNICAPRLQELALQLEHTDPAAEPAKADRLVESLAGEFDVVRTLLSEYVSAAEVEEDAGT